MNKNTIAKVIGWIGGALTILAANGAFGKYSSTIGSIAPLLSAGAVHFASDTSISHPNGKEEK